jgi:hypothetical protein
MNRVRVEGGGVAALCTARVLLAHGWAVQLAPSDRCPAPTLLLGPVTIDLLTRLFDDLEPLLTEAHRLLRRHTRWGVGAEPNTVGAPGVVVPESRLIEALHTRLAMNVRGRLDVDDAHAVADVDPAAAWVVKARGRNGLEAAPRHWFGARKIVTTDVHLRETSDEHCARMETTAEGWVFVTPIGGRRAVLQAMVADEFDAPHERLQRIVAGTRDIQSHVVMPLSTVRVFAAAPSIATQLGGKGHIAVGEEAVTLDPLCGDGVSFAIRGAILAAATIDGIARGLDETIGLAHYHARLAAALADHVRTCLAYYDVEDLEGAWSLERRAGSRALERLEGHLGMWPGFQLGLRGTSLVPLAACEG